MHKRIAILLVVAIASLGAGALAFGFWNGKEADARYRTARIERGAIVAATSASGTLNPVTTVQVGSQVSGQIRQLMVDFNSRVEEGQVIARIDPDTFETRVAAAEADLEVAKAGVLVQRAALERMRADLETVRANLTALRAQTSKAEIAVADAERDLTRRRALADRGVGTISDRDRSQAAFDSANAQLLTVRAQEQAQASVIRSAEAQVRSAEAQVVNAQATVKQREAALRQAKVDLERTYIRAPVSGVVILRNVDAGQTVAASLQAPILFTIAQDLREMQVETSVDEADVGRIREGQEASFTVDAFPGRQFRGQVQQIRKAPQIVQNVVTYTVIVSAGNRDQSLLPGMTANVRIITDQRESALRVPNAALRFRPAGFATEAAQAPQAAPPAAGAASPAQRAAEFRDRLVAELALDEAQKQELERIFGEMRQKIAAIVQDGSLAEADRRRQVEKARADGRGRIAAMLRPEQRARFEQFSPEGAGRSPVTQGRVFVLGPDGQPRAVPVRLGLSDGNATELVSGELSEGTEVIIGAQTPARTSAPAGSGAGGPRLRL
ncbi:MAG: HlyD family secretion protein [Alphaproteobacteria bacterium]|nr:HlyD family secretion protein [Alphaproteobacteria bacterium]